MVQEKKAIVSYVSLLKEDLVIIRMVPEDGVIPDYQAGQFLILGLPNLGDGGKIVRRAYSIASNPENKKYFEFVIRWVRKPIPGRLTTQIFNLNEGDEIFWLKPSGKALTINNKLHDGTDNKRRIVCIGGGTGIAPFVSFTRHLHSIGDKREIVVLHGASLVDELSYKEFFVDREMESNDRGKDQWNFTYRAAISRPQDWLNRSWGGHVGRVETFLRPRGENESALEELVGEKITPENTFFYICGWQGTIDGVMDFLKPKGFVTEHDKREDESYEVKFESYG